MAVCAGISTGPAPRRSFLCHNAPEGRIVTKRNAMRIRPEHIRFAVGYRSVYLGRAVLYAVGASLASRCERFVSMVPGARYYCLACLLLFRQHLSLSGRTPLVAGAALLTSLGDAACTYPTWPPYRALCDQAWHFFGWVRHLAPSWRGFRRLRAYWPARHHRSLRLQHRRVTRHWKLVLRQCDDAQRPSVLTSLLPMLSFVLLASAEGAEERGEEEETPGGLAGSSATAVDQEEERGSVPRALAGANAGTCRCAVGGRCPAHAGHRYHLLRLSSMPLCCVGRDDLSQLGAPSLVIPLAALFRQKTASGFSPAGRSSPPFSTKCCCARLRPSFLFVLPGGINGALAAPTTSSRPWPPGRAGLGCERRRWRRIWSLPWAGLPNASARRWASWWRLCSPATRSCLWPLSSCWCFGRQLRLQRGLQPA